MVKRYSIYIVLIGLVLLSCSKEQPATSLLTKLSVEATGIDFVNRIPEGADMNSHVYEYFYNGGGVSIGDINNDGLPDIYFTSNIFDNKLYLNKGDLRFEDITTSAGVAGTKGWTTGTCMADVNADGLLDIYVCKSGRFGAEKRANLLFINNGDQTFSEQAAYYGLNHSGYSTQASFFDYDLDGDLDMYLLNHNIDKSKLTNLELARRIPNEFAGDQLFENVNGKYQNVTHAAGIISNQFGYGLGVSIGDLNNDGWPDVYVGNDYMEHDYLYLNKGDKNGEHQGFEEVSKKVTARTSNFSMGTDMADINNDGLQDILVLDMSAQDNYAIKTSMSGMDPAKFNFAVDNGFHYQYMYNSFQLNRGIQNNQPFFSEIAQLSGLSSTDWSWAPLIVDLDGDGLKDVFVTNGLKRDFRNNDYRIYKKKRVEVAHTNGEDYKELMNELIANTPQRLVKNKMYLNQGNLQFKDSSNMEYLPPTFSNGAAFADLDLDGDLDLVLNNIDMEAMILRNNSASVPGYQYLQVRLNGPVGNPFGIGAKVKVITNDGFQLQEQYPTRGYQSSVDYLLSFGLGMANKADSIMVIWPDGKQEIKTGRNANQVITFNYTRAVYYQTGKIKKG
ncbi:MAG: CRTAC1 family protein [Reichenbachiella sp.]|uniref:CRTAC1 family protein n=1 Tax=Reichenbachiella sp. TaxID=2184521 RepID=UPI00329A6BF1